MSKFEIKMPKLGESITEGCRVNVSDLPAGIYILKVQTADEQSAVKFIKK